MAKQDRYYRTIGIIVWAFFFCAVLGVAASAQSHMVIDRHKCLEFNAGTISAKELLTTSPKRRMNIHLQPETLRHLLAETHTEIHIQELRGAIRHALGVDDPPRDCRNEEITDGVSAFIRPPEGGFCKER